MSNTSNLIGARWLDPREASESRGAPIADAVNIPLSEIPERTHELPSRQALIEIANCCAAASVAAVWLLEHGRRAVVRDDFEYADVQDGAPPHRLWEPNVFLRETVACLKPGAALDLACGCGRDAVFLSSMGWDVTGADSSGEALARAQGMAARYERAFAPPRWSCIDLESGPVEFERGYDLICGFRYLHRPLFARFADWLRPGGSVVYETFTTLHSARHGRPRRDAFVLQPGELPSLLDGFEIRHSSESWRGEAHTARVHAVAPFA